MGIRVPRITVNADFGDDTAFGDLSLLSVGYGLHQAWVYAVMFGTPTIFGTQTYVTGMYGSHASLPFLVSIVVFGLCLLFAGITDQRLLRTYISKKTLAAGAALMSAGTLLLLATPVISGPALEAVSGVMTGIGSAILILFWGVAFARCDSASIVLNSSIAISIAIGVYAIGLHYGPFPIAGILAGIIPLLELAILWNKTPAPYSERNEVPIFKPLPVNHAKFFLRFGIPVFVFGVAFERRRPDRHAAGRRIRLRSHPRDHRGPWRRRQMEPVLPPARPLHRRHAVLPAAFRNERQHVRHHVLGDGLPVLRGADVDILRRAGATLPLVAHLRVRPGTRHVGAGGAGGFAVSHRGGELGASASVRRTGRHRHRAADYGGGIRAAAARARDRGHRRTVSAGESRVVGIERPRAAARASGIGRRGSRRGRAIWKQRDGSDQRACT